MDDPFLLAHLINPLFFDIGGKLSPVSIRDQMIRGKMVIDRAHERGLLSTRRDDRWRTLLIVGAGVAGVTAAVRAAEEYGVTVLLVESQSGPFSRQASCTSRWVDPTQYDWPVVHWGKSYYHWKPPAMPLTWAADRANALAVNWTRQFNIARGRSSGRLHVLYNTKADNFNFVHAPGPPPTPITHVEADLHTPRGKLSAVPFGMVISCVGFGTEDCSAPLNYEGYRFWDKDEFEDPDLGTRRNVEEETIRVLIAGGGDGALQDLIRIVTDRKSAKDVYAMLPPAARERVEKALHSAEDQAQRAYIWGAHPLHDCVVHRPLQQSHQDALNELWNDPGIKHALCQQLSAVVRPSVLNGRIEVTLSYRCDHFANCYPLNRFLTLMLGKYLEEEHQIKLFRPLSSVLKVRGIPPHICHRSPAACITHTHEVSFGVSDCSVKRGHEIPDPNDETFQLVIIRYGIDPPKLTFASGSASRSSNPRQILPYHVSS